MANRKVDQGGAPDAPGPIPVTDPEQTEKTLATTSFVIHATRGVIRAQKIRRAVMLGLLVTAFCLLLLGFTVLQNALHPREHPIWFLIFWAACGWLTFTALLLALYDLLLVRVHARRARRALREELSRSDAGASTLHRP